MMQPGTWPRAGEVQTGRTEGEARGRTTQRGRHGEPREPQTIRRKLSLMLTTPPLRYFRIFNNLRVRKSILELYKQRRLLHSKNQPLQQPLCSVSPAQTLKQKPEILKDTYFPSKLSDQTNTIGHITPLNRFIRIKCPARFFKKHCFSKKCGGPLHKSNLPNLSFK